MSTFRQLAQSGAFCGVPLGMGSVNSWLAVPAFGEALSLALAAGAFAGAGIWMFRKWGRSPVGQADTGNSPGLRQGEQEPANA